MSFKVEILKEGSSDWEVLYLSGGRISDIKETGKWLSFDVLAIKYPDGRIWDMKEQKWSANISSYILKIAPENDSSSNPNC